MMRTLGTAILVCVLAAGCGKSSPAGPDFESVNGPRNARCPDNATGTLKIAASLVPGDSGGTPRDGYVLADIVGTWSGAQHNGLAGFYQGLHRDPRGGDPCASHTPFHVDRGATASGSFRSAGDLGLPRGSRVWVQALDRAGQWSNVVWMTVEK